MVCGCCWGKWRFGPGTLAIVWGIGFDTVDNGFCTGRFEGCNSWRRRVVVVGENGGLGFLRLFGKLDLGLWIMAFVQGDSKLAEKYFEEVSAEIGICFGL